MYICRIYSRYAKYILTLYFTGFIIALKRPYFCYKYHFIFNKGDYTVYTWHMLSIYTINIIYIY